MSRTYQNTDTYARVESNIIPKLRPKFGIAPHMVLYYPAHPVILTWQIKPQYPGNNSTRVHTTKHATFSQNFRCANQAQFSSL